MTKRTPTNIPASVHQLLLDKARQTHRPFNELLQYYAMERFLYRLSKSPHAGKFILKGALMFTAWKLESYRPTMDIDLLGKTTNQIDRIVAIAMEVCAQPVEPDGLMFNPSTVKGARIAENANYEGVRNSVPSELGYSPSDSSARFRIRGCDCSRSTADRIPNHSRFPSTPTARLQQREHRGREI